MDRACCCFTASQSQSRARSHDPLQRIIGIGHFGIIFLFLFVNSRKIVEDFVEDLRQKHPKNRVLVKILADKSVKPPLPHGIHGSSMDTKGHFATLLRNQQEGIPLRHCCMTSGLHETKRILFFNASGSTLLFCFDWVLARARATAKRLESPQASYPIYPIYPRRRVTS